MRIVFILCIILLVNASWLSESKINKGVRNYLQKDKDELINILK